MINTLKKREEFLSLRDAGDSIVTKGLVMQYQIISSNSPKPAQIGFTSSRKIGGAVYRNRCRRMFRECIRLIMRTNPELLKDNHHYNFIARYSTVKRPFEDLLKDFKYALHQVK